MTASYLGSYTISAALPGMSVVAAAGVGGLGLVLPGLLEQLAALQEFAPTSISIAAQISQLQTMITALELQASLGLPPPSLALQLAKIAEMIAALQALISQVQSALNIIVDFQGLLSTAGVQLIAFDGPASSFGAEVGAVVSTTLPGLTRAQALVLITAEPDAWAALSQIMKVST